MTQEMPVSHWGFLRQHQLTQLIKQLLTPLGFKLFSSGIRQWGLSQGNNSNIAIVTLPLVYVNHQVCAMAVDWGASGKAYGVQQLNNTDFSVVAPEVPFSVYFLSIGQ